MNKRVKWEDFLEKVSNFSGKEVFELDKKTKICDDIGMDSLGLYSIGMYLIKEYDANIPLSDLSIVESLEDMYILLNKN